VAAIPAPLSVRGVRIRHDGADQWTPDGVTFDLAPGDVLLVLGPSGCGKSTLALALNGLVPHAVPASLDGSVRVAGVDTADARVAELSEHVGTVFQDPDAQLVTATVLDEVCFGPENQLVPAGAVLQRAEAALRAVGLWERRADNPDTLSGGGKQRLAIACALALEAPVLVLDEPTANLDPAGAEEVYAVLGALTGPGSTQSVVLVEHNLDAALPVVNTVLVLDRDGRQVAHGPAAELFRERAEELAALGVWLPVATLAGLRLRDAGWAVERLPVTMEELAEVAAGLGVVVEARPDAGGRAADAAAAVEVRDLEVLRGKRVVLRDVSLRVGRGDFVAVLGANGAGKTSLVQAIAGVVRPPRGTVSVGGVDPARASVAALTAAVGFVFQNPEHQFVADSVEDELAYGLRVRRTPADEISRRVDAMLDTLDLSGQRDAHPYLLSGGQKRRLSVGTALIAGAPVLVLDEPTFGQDRARATELLGMLARLNDAGTTVVIVTHDLQLVAEYATHAAVLADGTLAAYGQTADVLGDVSLLERSGLRQPPLAAALGGVPGWGHVTRLADLPGRDERGADPDSAGTDGRGADGAGTGSA
jgi:energy-coupling factor transport system ATP-binding protein